MTAPQKWFRRLRRENGFGDCATKMVSATSLQKWFRQL
jgi:hypothetical protein